MRSLPSKLRCFGRVGLRLPSYGKRSDPPCWSPWRGGTIRSRVVAARDLAHINALSTVLDMRQPSSAWRGLQLRRALLVFNEQAGKPE